MLQLTHGLINRKSCYTAGNLKGLQWSSWAYTRLTGSNQPWLRWKPFSIGVAMKEIPLTRGLVALVDDEDFEALNRFKWHVTYYGYAGRKTSRSKGQRYYALFMHREIMGSPSGMEIDHIDRNKLNNCKSNLRICTHNQNAKNVGKKRISTSGYKGVSWSKVVGKWQSKIRSDNVFYHLGYFTDPKVAYDVYCEKAIELHGEFANLN